MRSSGNFSKIDSKIGVDAKGSGNFGRASFECRFDRNICWME